MHMEALLGAFSVSGQSLGSFREHRSCNPDRPLLLGISPAVYFREAKQH